MELTKTPKTKRLKPKQRLLISNWLVPESETFGNLYQSALKAGFAPTYALNISHLNPKWLSETIDQVDLRPEHIKQGIQRLATTEFNEKQSRSPADTNLKAYETLAKISGMIDNKHNTTVNIVQPILGGLSEKPLKVDVKQG